MKSLYKLQDVSEINEIDTLEDVEELNKISVPKFAPFFDNVGVEMLKANQKFTVQAYSNKEHHAIFTDEGKRIKQRLVTASAIIDRLIENMNIFFEKIDQNNQKKREACFKQIIELENFKNKFNLECQEKQIIFLGGYKGEVFSRTNDDNDSIKNYQGTFYKDTTTGLPFGLVAMEIQDNETLEEII
jgi:hypothetical protein